MNPIGTIQNLIFDVGDVLVHYEYEDLLLSLGLSRKETSLVVNFMKDRGVHPLWLKRDAGQIDTESMIQRFQASCPELSDALELFIRNENQATIIYEETAYLVHQLKNQGYRIYLLSNYSKDAFESLMAKASFAKDLDGAVISNEIGILKPDSSIYHFLLDTYHLMPQSCLFFDDRKKNTEAAKELGINTFCVMNQPSLQAKLTSLLI